MEPHMLEDERFIARATAALAALERGPRKRCHDDAAEHMQYSDHADARS